jgi:hypothetical protein
VALPREQLGEGANRDRESADDAERNGEEPKAIGRQHREVAQVPDRPLTDSEHDCARRNRDIDDKSRNARDRSQWNAAQVILVAALQ